MGNMTMHEVMRNDSQEWMEPSSHRHAVDTHAVCPSHCGALLSHEHVQGSYRQHNVDWPSGQGARRHKRPHSMGFMTGMYRMFRGGKDTCGCRMGG